MIKTKIAAIITATVLAAGVLYASSNVLPAVGGVEPNGGTTSCLPDNVQHWDKIIFQNKEEFTEGGPDEFGKFTIAVEKETIMDIKERDDPDLIEFPMDKVLLAVNQEWDNKEGDPITLKDVELIDVEYAIVCVIP